jgi:acetoin utilization protein AcuC
LSRGQGDVPARRYNFGPGDNPVFEGMYEAESLKAGGALQAAEVLLRSECDVAFNYAGGLHHAAADRASGFCVFNDPAIAIHWLLAQGLRAAYIDVDVHHGDGVQDAFYETDRVLTISLHQDGRTLFPGTGFVEEVGRGPGRGYSVNVPLPPYTDDGAYLFAFDQTVPPLLERFAPDIVVTQLGVDTHVGDPLAALALTTRGQRAVFERLARLSPRWLALGGGGYNLDVVPRAWTLAFLTMTGDPVPDRLPPGYAERYGGQWLEDREAPSIDPRTAEMVRERVEAVVAKVRQVHGIA